MDDVARYESSSVFVSLFTAYGSGKGAVESNLSHDRMGQAHDHDNTMR
jgi:hypothetical protein